MEQRVPRKRIARFFICLSPVRPEMNQIGSDVGLCSAPDVDQERVPARLSTPLKYRSGPLCAVVKTGRGADTEALPLARTMKEAFAPHVPSAQGYLAHKKQRPPRTLQ